MDQSCSAVDPLFISFLFADFKLLYYGSKELVHDDRLGNEIVCSKLEALYDVVVLVEG